jgi:hypothetical protein
MSAHNEIDVECEQCGEKFKGVIWTAINAVQDPELKDLLVGGELNILFCPKCSYTFFYEHFLLYQDPRLKLVAYVYPPEQEDQRNDLEVLMQRGFEEAQAAFDAKDRLPYRPTLFFGLDELKERIKEGEEKLLEEEVAEARRRSLDDPAD